MAGTGNTAMEAGQWPRIHQGVQAHGRVGVPGRWYARTPSQPLGRYTSARGALQRFATGPASHCPCTYAMEPDCTSGDDNRGVRLRPAGVWPSARHGFEARRPPWGPSGMPRLHHGGGQRSIRHGHVERCIGQVTPWTTLDAAGPQHDRHRKCPTWLVSPGPGARDPGNPAFSITGGDDMAQAISIMWGKRQAIDGLRAPRSWPYTAGAKCISSRCSARRASRAG